MSLNILTQIVLQLRAKNTIFGDMISGSLNPDLAFSATLSGDAAFVIPLVDMPTPNDQDVGVNQVITSSFLVLCAVRNDRDQADQTGIGAANLIETARAQIFSAILGWILPEMERGISYAGGQLYDLNRAYCWWGFTFSYDVRITEADGLAPENFPLLEKLYAQIFLQPGETMPIPGPLPVIVPTPDAGVNIDS